MGPVRKGKGHKEGPEEPEMPEFDPNGGGFDPTGGMGGVGF